MDGSLSGIPGDGSNELRGGADDEAAGWGESDGSGCRIRCGGSGHFGGGCGGCVRDERYCRDSR